MKPKSSLQKTAKKAPAPASVSNGIAIRCTYTRLASPNSLKPNPRNPNKHPESQLALYGKVIAHQGWRRAVVVSKRSGLIVTGHGAVETALLMGWPKVPVDDQDFRNADDELAHCLADNRLAELAELSQADVAAIVKELDGKIDLDLTGFDADALAGLNIGNGAEVDAEPQIDRAAELQKEWKTKRGQIWELGEHRLMCGDCRESKDMDLLFPRGPFHSMHMAFTSPPYAAQRDYDEASGFKPIPPDEFVQWFEPVQENIKRHFERDGSWFINIKPCADGLDTSLYCFDLVIAHVRRWSWHFATEFCWERNGVPKSVTRRFKNQFEPVYQFSIADWKMRPEAVQHPSDNVPIPFGKGAGQTSWANKQGGNGSMFGGSKRKHGSRGRTMSSVPCTEDSCFELSAPGMAYPGNRLPSFTESHTATGHTAAFPVGLPSFFIKAYTDPGNVVYDPFSGSGTTIIACENLNRRCRAMEISPAYVAVTLQRYQDATSKTPKLISHA